MSLTPIWDATLAEDWAKEHVRNGSWSVIKATPPSQIVTTA